MSAAVQFYVTSVLIVFAVNVLACWALDLQVGTTGVLNFGFILFQAAGAYTVGVLTMGPPTIASQQHYVGGAHLPFFLALAVATLVGGALALPLGWVALRKLRADYQAIVLLVISIIAADVALSAPNLVNGAIGLFPVPSPFAGAFGLSQTGYQWFYLGLCVCVCAVVYFVLRRILRAPLGRALRATRDCDTAASSLGKHVNGLRMMVFIIGGGIAALSGGLFVGYLGAWAPSGWTYPETFVYITAIIVGGRGNMLGAVIGAFLVPGFSEISQFLPFLGNPAIAADAQWVFVGVLLLIFLWFWPRGIVPERLRRISLTAGANESKGLLHAKE